MLVQKTSLFLSLPIASRADPSSALEADSRVCARLLLALTILLCILGAVGTPGADAAGGVVLAIPKSPSGPFPVVQFSPSAGGGTVIEIGRTFLSYDGKLNRDHKFADHGRLVIKPLAGTVFEPVASAVDTKGRIVVAGNSTPSPAVPTPVALGCGSSAPSSATIFRFLPSGRPDRGFGQNGHVSSDLGLPSPTCRENGGEITYGPPEVEVTGLAVDTANRPVLTGKFVKESNNCFAHSGSDRAFLARLQINGAPDPSFAGTGVRIDESISLAFAPLVNPSGGWVFQASGGAECGRPGASARLLGNIDVTGAPETSFGSGGFKEVGFEEPFEVPPGDFGFAGKVSVDRQGRILLLEDRVSPPAVRVARLNPDGQVDQSFGDNGTAVVALPSRVGIQAIGVDPQGRVLLAGYRLKVPCGHCRKKMERKPAPAFVLSRLEGDGRRDRSFGSDGWMQRRFPGFGSNAQVSIGRILFSGNKKIRLGGVLSKGDPALSEAFAGLEEFSIDN